MPDTDPGSLDRLHDIVVPPPVPWWPPAPGWYVVGGIAFVLLGWGIWTLFARWRRNRYRREGVRELDAIAADANSPAALDRTSELVKRVALVAYPRDRVASLTGLPWLEFLDSTGRSTEFTRGPGQKLGEIYHRDSLFEHTAPAALIKVVRHWIRHHRC